MTLAMTSSASRLFAHEGMPYGTIRIKTRSDDSGRGIWVTFADTGAGIRPEHLDNIFNPFFTTKPVGKGTGLGLSVCYSIIRRLGGEIRVKSRSGEGAEFIIFLPTNPPQELQESLAHG